MDWEAHFLRRVESNSGLGKNRIHWKTLSTDSMASIEDSLEYGSYELDYGCSEHRSNLAISSHGLATVNCCMKCKVGMLSVCSC